MRMYNPPHPGEVIREYLGEMTVSAAAEHLGVGRVTFSRVLNGKAAVSPEMAVRLAAAFGTSSPEVWLRMQAKYDLKSAAENGRQHLGKRNKAESASIRSPTSSNLMKGRIAQVSIGMPASAWDSVSPNCL
jgi:addiction module HigA family antidote